MDIFSMDRDTLLFVAFVAAACFMGYKSSKNKNGNSRSNNNTPKAE